MTPPQKPITRSAAWIALLTNLFVMPGVGSWMAGQRLLGAVHFLMSCAGVGMMMVWLCWFMFQWIKSQSMPQARGPVFLLAAGGVVLFAAAWLWSLMVSIALVRRTGPDPAAGQPSGAPPELK